MRYDKRGTEVSHADSIEREREASHSFVVFFMLISSNDLFFQLQISLNDSLSKLKEQVLECTSIPVEHQRIFCMGREMKTNGRSLETLGVGRFGIMVIHVHNTNPAPNKSGGNRRRGRGVVKQNNTRKETIVLETSNNSSSSAPGRRNRSQQQQQQEIVELLDDSDDEDDRKVAAYVIDMTEESSPPPPPTATSRNREGSKRRRIS